MNYYECTSDLTALKKSHKWLSQVDSTALITSLKDLDMAYNHFFRRLQQGEKPGYPRFKSKRDKYQSYRSNCVNNRSIQVSDGAVKLAKLGWVRCSGVRPIEGRILSATISQVPSGKYFISVCCTGVTKEALPHTGQRLHVSWNSDGVFLHEPNVSVCTNTLKKNMKRIARMQRQLSRKKKDGKNWEKKRKRLASLHESVANQRRDTLQKLSMKLVCENDVIYIENISVKKIREAVDLKDKSGVSDTGWNEFERMLNYKTQWFGKQLIKTNTVGGTGIDACGDECR